MDLGAFEVLAEVAVGVAGFASIAIVIDRDNSAWQSADFARTSFLVFASFGALFLALIPIGLGTTQLAPESIWRLSSASILLYGVPGTIVMWRVRSRHMERAYWLGPMLVAAVSVSSAANVIAQVANVSGVAFAPNPACCFFGILHLLAFGCMVLVRLVFMRPSDSR